MSSDVRRASHTHQVPHMGFPQTAPVHKARNVNIAPVGAMAVAIMEERRVLNASPMPAQTAIIT